MGIYTEFVFAFEVHGELPSKVINTLKWLCGIDENPGEIDNELTKYYTFGHLGYSGDSFPKGGKTTLTLFDDGTYDLVVRMVVKNSFYYGERFLLWIAPYMVTQGFVGYRHVESERFPTLIYTEAYKVFLVDIAEKERKQILSSDFQ